MKICMLGDITGNIDEGMKSITYNLSKRLRRRHNVLVLNPLDFTSPKFWKVLKEFHPDIVHYIPGPSFKSFALMKLISYFLKYSTFVMSSPFPQLSKFSMRIIPKMKPDMMIVQSKKHLDIFRKLGFNVHLVPLCGVDTEKFTPVKNDRKKKLRAKYGFDENTFLVLHVGHIKSGRNILSLKSLEGKDNTHLIIVGSTSTGIEKNIYKELKRAGCTVITEYIPNLEEIYQLSDCYVFPVTSRTSSIVIPLSVLEAMSCNLPVITTKFGALTEYFPEVPGVYYIEHTDEIQRRLAELKSTNLQIMTREYVLQYDWDKIVKKLEEIYICAIKSKKE